jgi:hypothetical protein
MNYTFLENAYTIHHSNPTSYNTNQIKYSPICIYCSNPTSQPLLGDSFRRCDRCKKEFKSTIISKPVDNFTQATRHLKGTN